MSTETLEIEQKAAVKQPDVLILELCDSKPSSYIMDGPNAEDFDNLDKTRVISFPSLRKIRNTSRIKHWTKDAEGKRDTFIYKTIRYINGCPFIEKEKQELEGWKPNYLADDLLFKAGHMRVTREGDIGKFLYLAACEYNTSVADRPDDAEDVFKEINTEIDSQEEESEIDLRNEAQAIVSSLKTKANGKEFRYNEDAIEFLCSLFKIPSSESGFKSEAWVALARLADQEPKKFIQSVGNVRSLTEADVFSAVQLGVVQIDQQKAFFVDGNKIIMQFESGLDEEEKGQALVDFMTNPKSKKFYEQLRMQLQAKKQAIMEVKK